MSYFRRILISLDQFANTLCNGFPDETLSSRLGRARKRKGRIGDIGCVVLDVIDAGHCAGSIEENPDGSTDAHHLGKVIHELPPDRLTKLRRAGL